MTWQPAREQHELTSLSQKLPCCLYQRRVRGRKAEFRSRGEIIVKMATVARMHDDAPVPIFGTKRVVHETGSSRTFHRTG
jgi:hypothetical protein